MNLITVHHPILFWLLVAFVALLIWFGGALCGAVAAWVFGKMRPAVTAVTGVSSPVGLALLVAQRFLHDGGSADTVASLISKIHDLRQPQPPPIPK